MEVANIESPVVEQVDEAAHQASLGLAPGDEVSDTEGLEAIACMHAKRMQGRKGCALGSAS